jgi:hypothetical protein
VKIEKNGEERIQSEDRVTIKCSRGIQGGNREREKEDKGNVTVR